MGIVVVIGKETGPWLFITVSDDEYNDCPPVSMKIGEIFACTGSLPASTTISAAITVLPAGTWRHAR